MEFKEYEKFVEDVDFMDGALNVYRTKNYIVRQEISIENIEGKTITFSKDTFFRRTEERDLYYNYIFCFRTYDNQDGTRVPVMSTSRRYVD